MSTDGFASTPTPPYYVAIFASQRNDEDEAGYAAAAERMLELAQQQPGFLGFESVRGANGFGLTLSYWESEAAILAWKQQGEHAATRARGRRDWYSRYQVRVARVERAYGMAPKDAQ